MFCPIEERAPKGRLRLLRSFKKKGRTLLAAGILTPMLAMTPTVFAEKLLSNGMAERLTSENCRTVTKFSGSVRVKPPVLPPEGKSCVKKCKQKYRPGKRRAACIAGCESDWGIPPTL